MRVGGVDIVKIRGLYKPIFCCIVIRVFIAVNTCEVSYVMLACEGNVFFMQRGSWNV